MSKKEPHPFVSDLLALKLQFPVATIAKRTGDSKDTVSAIVRGRRQPSPGFLLRFYNAFKDDLAAIGINRQIAKLPELPSTRLKLSQSEILQRIEDLEKRVAILEKKVAELWRRIT